MLKCECFQPGGAFKLRGACNMIAQLSPAARSAGVITYSSGNHGRAVALVAEAFGAPAVIVMPETTPRVKVDGVLRHGAEVVFAGTTSIDRKARAEEIAAARGLTIVPPFDHPWIIAGQGTTGLEILDQHPRVRSVYVPVGGGGQSQNRRRTQRRRCRRRGASRARTGHGCSRIRWQRRPGCLRGLHSVKA
jgi:threonine dehydratase